MSWQHTVYAYPIVASTVLSIGFAAYAVRYGRRHGRTTTLTTFAAMNVAVAWWTAFSAIKLLSTDPTVKLQAYRLLHLGGGMVGPLLLGFALAYTGRARWVRPRVVAPLIAVPVLYVFLLFTNPYDVAIVQSRLVDVEGLVVWRAETGPAYILFSFLFAATMAVATLGVIWHEAVRLGRSYLPQAALLTVAVVTPVTASLLTSAGVAPFGRDGVNLVPASAAVSMTAIGVALVRYRLLDLPNLAYTTMVEQSPDGVLVLDAERRIVHANETVSALLGRDAVVGDRLDSALPSVAAALGAVNDRARGSDSGAADGSRVPNASADIGRVGDDPEEEAVATIVDVSDAGGSTGYLDVRSRPLRQHGRVVGWVVVCRDVTEQRRRERELEAFTAVVSHDLREPLRTTEAYLDLLEKRHGDAVNEDGRELLTVARANSRRMRQMIADLQQYSQIGPSAVAFGSVDCDRVVTEVLESLRFEIEDRDATVVVDDLPTVDGVEHLLRRAFQNLIANALEHSSDGGPEIRIAATRRDGDWAFTVSDDGVGIEPGERERVFDLFTRGSNAGGDAGTGMGLAICKKIVELHGGRIDVDSAPGEGTAVTFTVPDEDSTTRG